MTHRPDFYHPKAVVLGLGINGLGIIRSLGTHGLDIRGIYTSELEFGRFSCYVEAIRSSLLSTNKEILIQKFINDFGDIKEKPVLFVDNDSYVMFISHHRELLQQYFRFNLTDKETLESLISKDRSSDFVTTHGLRVPRTYVLNENSINEIITGIDYPCLMKPVDSFSVNFDEKVMIFSDRSSLDEFIDKRPELIGQVIIQQIIPGGDPNTYQATTYVTRDGIICPIFTMQKVRQYRPDFGITSYGLSIDIPEIKEKVHTFLETTDYRGFISMEFKQHPDTGEWYYIEANPRLPYYNSLIFDSGLNYPYTYYQDMLGLDTLSRLENHQTSGTRWICFSKEIASFVEKYSNGQMSFGNWLISVIKSRSFAYFHIKDLKPFYHALIHHVKILVVNVRKRLTQFFLKSAVINAL